MRRARAGRGFGCQRAPLQRYEGSRHERPGQREIGGHARPGDARIDSEPADGETRDHDCRHDAAPGRGARSRVGADVTTVDDITSTSAANAAAESLDFAMKPRAPQASIRRP